MAKCKNCNNLIDLSDITSGSEKKFKWCPIKNDNLDIEAERDCSSYQAMTNADRIRNMTDEELAEFLERFGTFNQPCNLSDGKPLKWLKSQVEV